MTPSDLFTLFDSNPERSYRLSLTSGEQVDVTRAGDTTIDGSMLFVPARVGKRGAHNKMHIIALVNIAMIVPIEDAGAPHSSN